MSCWVMHRLLIQGRGDGCKGSARWMFEHAAEEGRPCGHKELLHRVLEEIHEVTIKACYWHSFSNIRIFSAMSVCFCVSNLFNSIALCWIVRASTFSHWKKLCQLFIGDRSLRFCSMPKCKGKLCHQKLKFIKFSGVSSLGPLSECCLVFVLCKPSKRKRGNYCGRYPSYFRFRRWRRCQAYAHLVQKSDSLSPGLLTSPRARSTRRIHATCLGTVQAHWFLPALHQ